MLPIHMICSDAQDYGLRPPMELPTTAAAAATAAAALKQEQWDALASLQLLAKVYPAGLDARTANGMTPRRWVQESMEEGSIDKRLCLDILTNIEHSESMDSASTTKTADEGFPTEISCFMDEAPDNDQDMMRFQVHFPIYSLLLARDWNAAANLISVEPDQASEWQYGMETDPLDNAADDQPKLWKRLPIHQACRMGAPLALIELLHSVYPPGIAAKDPYSGALALHHACCREQQQQESSSLQEQLHVVAFLARNFSAGAKIADHRGRMPLHWACRSGASPGVLYTLLKAHPGAVCDRDEQGMTPCEYVKKKGEFEETAVVALLDRVSAVMIRVHRKRENEARP